MLNSIFDNFVLYSNLYRLAPISPVGTKIALATPDPLSFSVLDQESILVLGSLISHFV